MKKSIIFVCLMVLTFSTSAVYANMPNSTYASESATFPPKKESKLSAEELTRLTNRVEEIRNMDKSKLTTKEKSELKKELKSIKKNVKKSGGYIYISAGTLILIIILVLILL
ncbi:MAG: hypothetical protein ABI851_03485 [Saprospiraceae bacterium]